MTLIPVIPAAKIKAWPKHDSGGRARYLPLATALLATFETDAHTAGYSCPAIERRLDYGAIRDASALEQLGGVVPMLLGIFDVDAAESHKALGGESGAPASDEWWMAELAKIEALRAVHANLYVYRTRGGYRVVGLLPEPFELRSQQDADRWTQTYLTWVAYLRRAFSIVADPGCKEWNRLYRLPKATRDEGGRPERREAIGSPSNIGVWTPEITDADRDAAVVLAARKTAKRKQRTPSPGGYRGPGILHHIFREHDWLGDEIESGKWSVKCPKESEHSKGVEFDTSTVLMSPGDGETFGLVHCSHSNSGHDRYTLREWIACFEQSEIDAAREALGIPKWTPTTTKSGDDGERVDIELGGNLTENVDLAIEALARRDIFQRGGTLVDIIRSAERTKDKVVRPDGSPRIRMLPNARLREELNQAARFLVWKKDDGELVQVEVPPPADIVATLSARGQWPHIRPLAGIVDWPVLRRDGSVFTGPGYDPETQILSAYTPGIEVPEAPTKTDAERAALELLDVVTDFPFVNDASRSAWLAALLTLPARAAINGPTPMLLLDANTRGAGKTLLADTIGMIVMGRQLPRRTAPDEAAEWRKAMLGIAIAADPIILVDNVTRMLKSDALDAVLTGTEFRERVLGKNEELVLPIHTMFITTMNNGTVSTDLVRRSLHGRIEAQTERPEQKTGYRYHPLLEHCRKHRARLLGAALTILRAYSVAGRPKVELRNMGSYEEWTTVVRAALVWAGQPDPAKTQDVLRESADVESETIGTLFPAWYALHRDRALTVRDVLEDLKGEHLDDRRSALKDALGVLCNAEAGKLPTPQKLGYRLRSLRGVIKGDFVFQRASDHGETGVKWRVNDRNPDDADNPDDSSHSSRARSDYESNVKDREQEQGASSASSVSSADEGEVIYPPAGSAADNPETPPGFVWRSPVREEWRQ